MADLLALTRFLPATMEKTPFAGVNLAIWYGMLLIIGAFVLALVYGLVCDPHDAPEDQEGGAEG